MDARRPRRRIPPGYAMDGCRSSVRTKQCQEVPGRTLTVFGIIKAALGFRQFSLRGLAKVRTAWTLVTLAYHLQRLYHLGTRLQAA